MENIQILEEVDSMTGEPLICVIIDHGNGEFTSMPKSVYDAQLEAANRENNV